MLNFGGEIKKRQTGANPPSVTQRFFSPANLRLDRELRNPKRTDSRASLAVDLPGGSKVHMDKKPRVLPLFLKLTASKSTKKIGKKTGPKREINLPTIHFRV